MSKSVDRLVVNATTFSSVTLSMTGLGLIVCTEVACVLPSSEKVKIELIQNRYILKEKI